MFCPDRTLFWLVHFQHTIMPSAHSGIITPVQIFRSFCVLAGPVPGVCVSALLFIPYFWMVWLWSFISAGLIFQKSSLTDFWKLFCPGYVFSTHTVDNERQACVSESVVGLICFMFACKIHWPVAVCLVKLVKLFVTIVLKVSSISICTLFVILIHINIHVFVTFVT